MSPGKTMVRVYDALKARVMNGEFSPGSRLDPMVLRRDFGSSATPVRDALHRLTGERLVESWRNEGFRFAHVSEPAIRDLYEWTHEISHIVLRAASRHQTGPVWHSEPLDYPGHLRRILTHAAAWSRSFEHAWATENLSDRSSLLWRGEAMLFGDGPANIAHIEQALANNAWTDASKGLDHLHRIRLRAVPEIAAWIRRGQAEYRDNVF